MSHRWKDEINPFKEPAYQPEGQLSKRAVAVLTTPDERWFPRPKLLVFVVLVIAAVIAVVTRL